MSKIRIGASAVVIPPYLYVLGGETGEVGQTCSGPETCFTATYERSRVATDGSLGPWELVGKMRSERWGFATVIAGTFIYVIGGNDEKSAVASVERGRITPDGSIVQWLPMKPMTSPRWALSAVYSNGFIYSIGGRGPEYTARTVERARVRDDGSLDDWEIMESTLINRRHGAGAAILNGRLYMIGGESGGGAGEPSSNETLDTYESAPIDADGNLGSWELAGRLHSPRALHGTSVVGESIYVTAGINAGVFLPTVERILP